MSYLMADEFMRHIRGIRAIEGSLARDTASLILERAEQNLHSKLGGLYQVPFDLPSLPEAAQSAIKRLVLYLALRELLLLLDLREDGSPPIDLSDAADEFERYISGEYKIPGAPLRRNRVLVGGEIA